MEIPKGLCQCGCGQQTSIARQTRNDRGDIEGEPVKFALGHSPRRRGGNFLDNGGYLLILKPNHRRGDGCAYVREHILIAEKALGKTLPPKAVVHHHTPKQLVICQDQAYHILLHLRTRALRACGHVNWRKCPFCKEYDDPNKMHNRKRHKRNDQFYHQDCKAAANQKAQPVLNLRKREKRQALKNLRKGG